jgi:hypothetical protein
MAIASAMERKRCFPPVATLGVLVAALVEAVCDDPAVNTR